MGSLFRRLGVLLRRGRLDRELEEEMRFHLELKTEENRENGMRADDARCAALRQFGNALCWSLACQPLETEFLLTSSLEVRW